MDIKPTCHSRFEVPEDWDSVDNVFQTGQEFAAITTGQRELNRPERLPQLLGSGINSPMRWEILTHQFSADQTTHLSRGYN